MKNISYTRGSGILEGFLAKQRARKANGFIPVNYREGKILDIGCGFYPYFLISTKFKEKYGIDPFVDTSSVKGKNIILKKISVGNQKLSFENTFFDVVTMLAIFEHIDHDKLKNVLSEIKRVLRKDGILIITTPAPWADKLLHFMAKVGLISSEEIHEHKHNHPKKKIERILEEAGFEKEKIKSGFFELGLNMWFVVKK